jgi:hypothetical protein
MLALIEYNLPTLIAALVIGIATGWWTFGAARTANSSDKANEELDPR